MTRLALVIAVFFSLVPTAPVQANSPYSPFFCGHGLFPPCVASDYLTILSIVRAIPKF